MNRRRNLIITILVCAGICVLAFFAEQIPFYIYEEEELHTTVEQFFSLQHLVRMLPLLIIILLAAAGILVITHLWKDRRSGSSSLWKGSAADRAKQHGARRDPGSRNSGRQKTKRSAVRIRSIGEKSPTFMKVRWILMIAFSLLVMFGGILTGLHIQGIALPVLACPTNMDQMVESSCYFLAHIPTLLEEYSAGGVILFFGSTIGFAILLGRTICGFLCPMGLIQDVMHKIRQKMKAKGIEMTESRYSKLKPIRWILILLMLGLVFAGGEFCAFCPALTTSPILAGMQVSLHLSAYMMIFVLIGSFFKRRFWCNICPLGYLIGLLHRISPFRIKKDVQACTECGACYEACPMGIKGIYTEREKTDVTESTCILCGECIRKCPEDNALAMTFAGKKIYTASRRKMMSGYEEESKA